MMKRIPGTDKIIFLSKHDGDVVYNMRDVVGASTAVAQEDVLVTGSWQDYQGSGTTTTFKAGMQGQANQLDWEIQAKVDGQRFGGVTERGANLQTHRQRNRLITMEVK